MKRTEGFVAIYINTPHAKCYYLARKALLTFCNFYRFARDCQGATPPLTFVKFKDCIVTGAKMKSIENVERGTFKMGSYILQHVINVNHLSTASRGQFLLLMWALCSLICAHKLDTSDCSSANSFGLAVVSDAQIIIVFTGV